MTKEEQKEKEGGESQNSEPEDAAQIFPRNDNAGAENGGIVE